MRPSDTRKLDELVQIIKQLGPLIKRHNALVTELENEEASEICHSLGVNPTEACLSCEGQHILALASHRVATVTRAALTEQGYTELEPQIHFGFGPHQRN